jgi:hypothetical protein
MTEFYKVGTQRSLERFFTASLGIAAHYVLTTLLL